jgi:hypothetical protein
VEVVHASDRFKDNGRPVETKGEGNGNGFDAKDAKVKCEVRYGGCGAKCRFLRYATEWKDKR